MTADELHAVLDRVLPNAAKLIREELDAAQTGDQPATGAAFAREKEKPRVSQLRGSNCLPN
jgi:hypothetical protein